MTNDRKKLIMLASGAVLLILALTVAVSSATHNGRIIYNEVELASMPGTHSDISYDRYAGYEESSGDILVNINTAYADELAKYLPGIGEKRAAAIVEYREVCGGFNSVEELLNVEGIGSGVYAKMCMYCTTEGPRIISVEKVVSSSD